MARPAKMSRAGLAEKLTPVFQQYGYDGASLAMLADAVGLSKASLYHHFPRGKEDMALYALAHSGARLQKLVLAPLAGRAEPAQRLSASLEGTGLYYDGDIPHCLMNSLLLGEGRHLFGGRIAKAVSAWRAALAATCVAGGAGKQTAVDWAGDALERLQGALVLCRVSGGRAPLEACLDKLVAAAPIG
ncbi:MAG: TetR/AcrR family transcriptional regulator [Alphaproteobacteria bacterium]|nr:MAG: TetR/AcrR family transcriptional regulator [Alphaproteobacteria bacterium]